MDELILMWAEWQSSSLSQSQVLILSANSHCEVYLDRDFVAFLCAATSGKSKKESYSSWEEQPELACSMVFVPIRSNVSWKWSDSSSLWSLSHLVLKLQKWSLQSQIFATFDLQSPSKDLNQACQVQCIFLWKASTLHIVTLFNQSQDSLSP